MNMGLTHSQAAQATCASLGANWARVCSTLLICLSSLFAGPTHANQSHPNAPSPDENEFHFVVLGDAQFDAPAVFNRVVDQARRLNPAFVIQVGDLIEGYNSNMDEIHAEWARFKKQIAPLAPIPYLPVPGNHDVYNGDKKPDAALDQLFAQHWGASYFSFNYKNTLIVGLNSDEPGAINRIAGEQWQWLAKTLEGSNATHKMVFIHRPPWLLENAQDVHNLFKRTGVSHAIYGHHHHYHHIERDGVKYTMTNAAGDSAHERPEIGGMPHLLHVSVRDDEVSVAAIEADAILQLNAVIPGDNYDYFNLGRGIAPDEVTLKSGSTNDSTVSFALDIPLRNSTQREIRVQVSCYSEDERWIFDPLKISPITLAPKERQTLNITAFYEQSRQPESTPSCQLQVPFQTEYGQWLDFNHTVNTKRPQ